MRNTIQELTGLRGVAALLILIGHSVAVAPVLKTWLSYFGNSPALTIPNLLVHFGLTYLTAWGVYKLYGVPMRRKIRTFFA